MQLLFLGNIGASELLVLILGFCFLIILPFTLGYFIGLAKGRKESIKYAKPNSTENMRNT